MNLLWYNLLRLLVAIALLFTFCEFLIYYIVAVPYSWPKLPQGDEKTTPLHALFLSDTHLLGNRMGHWFDKLRREWQMERAFQAAMTLTSPEVVFVLGDLTDEGKWASDKEFAETVQRFRKMFRVSKNVEFHVVVGNHDIGFHESVTRNKLTRFQEMFDIPPVQILTIKGNVMDEAISRMDEAIGLHHGPTPSGTVRVAARARFVLVNSMAMHGDGCFMCSPAMDKLRVASEHLNCTRYGSPWGTVDKSQLHTAKKRCQKHHKLPNVKPLLLQHFPLYRPSEAPCQGSPDEPSAEEVNKINREKFHVLSKQASQQLLSWIQPRMIVSGHTHHGCYVVHPGGVPELSVPSFSWRNRNNPSLIMATISKDHFEYSKCFIPEETSVITIYIFSASLMLVCFFMSVLRNWGRRFKKYR